MIPKSIHFFSLYVLYNNYVCLAICFIFIRSFLLLGGELFETFSSRCWSQYFVPQAILDFLHIIQTYRYVSCVYCITVHLYSFENHILVITQQFLVLYKGVQQQTQAAYQKSMLVVTATSWFNNYELPIYHRGIYPICVKNGGNQLFLPNASNTTFRSSFLKIRPVYNAIFDDQWQSPAWIWGQSIEDSLTPPPLYAERFMSGKNTLGMTYLQIAISNKLPLWIPVVNMNGYTATAFRLCRVESWQGWHKIYTRIYSRYN